MQYASYKEIYEPEHVYVFRSIPCPTAFGGCGSQEEIEVKAEELHAYHQNGLIQKLASLTPEQRERFVTGFCSDCWDKLFTEP